MRTWERGIGLTGLMLAIACGDDERTPSNADSAITLTGIGSTGDGPDDAGTDDGTGSGSGSPESCTVTSECPDGFACIAGECLVGCGIDADCFEGLACCGNQCVDLAADAANCLGCGNACADGFGCGVAGCQLEACPGGTFDCDGVPDNGCELTTACDCVPGEVGSCYTGSDPTTEGVGECRAGTRVCNDTGSAWGPCEGVILPAVEICGNGLDEDCNGTIDDDVDQDGDGFGSCSGDCCDIAGPACLDPVLVNRGAFEIDGNMVDDDCDGTVDNPVPACDVALASNTTEPLDYARAIDLCQFTQEAPADPNDRTWGVLSAALTRANGAGTPGANGRALREQYGTNVLPRFGQRIAVLSTGSAADLDDVNPGFADFQPGQARNETSGLPADWIAANNNNIPNAPGCPDAQQPNTAFDSVLLRVRTRVPTNANSFSVDMFFYSAEYPEYVCTPFNDFFVTLVTSGVGTNPPDGNIAIYDTGVSTFPVGINLVSAAAGLFTACQNGTIAQCGTAASYNGCTSTTELLGTGFDIVETTDCGYNGMTGGGTGWLTMSGNVVPGEIIEVRFIIWDTGDGIFDSLVLLDNWQWSVEASEPGVAPS